MSVVSTKMLQAAAGASGGDTYWIAQWRDAAENLTPGVTFLTDTTVYAAYHRQNYGSVMALDSVSGTKLWDFGTKGRKEYGAGSMPESAYTPGVGVNVDSNGIAYIHGYYNGGVTGTAIAGKTSQFTKYDRATSTTTPQWVYTWGKEYYEQSGSGLQGIDSSDNVYSAGSLVDGPYKGYVGKFNSSGTNQWWRRVYNSSYNVYGLGCHITSTDKVIFFGHQNTPSVGYKAPFLVRFNSSGTEEAKVTLLHGNGNQTLYSAYPHTDDTILLTYRDDVAGNGYFLTHMNMNTFGFVNRVKVLQAFTGGKSGTLLPRAACVDSAGYAYVAFSASGATDSGGYFGKFDLSNPSWEWFCRVYNPTSASNGTFQYAAINANDTPIFTMIGRELSGEKNRSWCLKLPPDGSFIGNTYYNMQFTDYSAYAPTFGTNSATTTSSYIFTTSATADNTSYTTSVPDNVSNATTLKTADL